MSLVSKSKKTLNLPEIESTQAAMLNILEDFKYDALDVDQSRRAMISVLKDLDESNEILRQTISKLKFSEEKLALSLESAKMGFWDYNLLTNLADRNLRHDQIFGYTSLQPVWNRDIFNEHISPEERANVDACFEASLINGDFNLKSKIVWLDGSLHWISMRGQVYFEDNKPVRIAAIITDITKEKNTELRVLQQKSLSDAILASIGDGLVVADKKGEVTFVNKGFEDLTGWKSKEVIGKELVTVLPVEDSEGSAVQNPQEILNQILAGQNITSNFEKVMYNVRKDGSSFPVSSIMTPIRLHGEVVGLVKTFHDITKEKDIDKAKTEFVSLASHQLRTPLSAINWYTEMLLSGDVGQINAQQERYLTEVFKGNQRMISLVNALLNVSRMSLGTFTLEPEQTDVTELIRSVVAEQQIEINKKSILFSITEDNSIPFIHTDPKLIRIVIENLLSNAIKYTPELGTIALNLSLDTTRKKLLCSVIDSGYGIPLNQQPQIFNKLFRADNVREKDTEGSGLGLYIVKAIVDNSGGKVWFESKENQGTSFHVELPITHA